MHPSPPLAIALLTALVAPAGLKKGLGAREVTDHRARRVLDSMLPARVRTTHAFDGGERFEQWLSVRLRRQAGWPASADTAAYLFSLRLQRRSRCTFD
jgi:hypothetical protein